MVAQRQELTHLFFESIGFKKSILFKDLNYIAYIFNQGASYSYDSFMNIWKHLKFWVVLELIHDPICVEFVMTALYDLALGQIKSEEGTKALGYFYMLGTLYLTSEKNWKVAIRIQIPPEYWTDLLVKLHSQFITMKDGHDAFTLYSILNDKKAFVFVPCLNYDWLEFIEITNDENRKVKRVLDDIEADLDHEDWNESTHSLKETSSILNAYSNKLKEVYMNSASGLHYHTLIPHNKHQQFHKEIESMISSKNNQYQSDEKNTQEIEFFSSPCILNAMLPGTPITPSNTIMPSPSMIPSPQFFMNSMFNPIESLLPTAVQTPMMSRESTVSTIAPESNCNSLDMPCIFPEQDSGEDNITLQSEQDIVLEDDDDNLHYLNNFMPDLNNFLQHSQIDLSRFLNSTAIVSADE